ncbi:hypothetical protein F5B20DRAFT_498056 [Whalleya microplaca]|nr:hypothetical protein F5B20DRAFT_498056 [Whalleya microplaca]
MFWSLFLSVAASSFACLIAAQPIQAGSRVLSAGETNISPAQELIAGFNGPEAYQLTNAVVASLYNIGLPNISLFGFGNASSASVGFTCKVFPGEESWPKLEDWAILNHLTGGALIETVPIGASCYLGEHYDATRCQTVLNNWTDSYLHDDDPTSVMWLLPQGATCLPQNGNISTCELGSYPPYSVNATTVAQVQLAINFARNTGIRLVIHNTGHDYLGKSTGAGALSIWTHNFKAIEFIQNYTSSSSSYKGPAFKLGAGIQDFELYEAADKAGVTAMGGEGRTVGVTGGFTQGGGHSPLSPKYGMGADQVLSIDVVTADGQFLTADEQNHSDLFWAIRGGGGGTFGVVTSMTVKVYPKMTVSGMTWTVISGDNETITNDLFWAGISAYWCRFPGFAEAGSYAYSTLFPTGQSGFIWDMRPWMVAGMNLTEFKALVAPLIDEWDALGFAVEPTYFEHDNFLDTWNNHFPDDPVGNPYVRTVSRLFPKETWVNPTLLNETVNSLRNIVNNGSSLISYNTNGAAPEDAPPNAVVPAWRDAYMFAIVGTEWSADASEEEIKDINIRIDGWIQQLRKLTPGGGTYLNEGDIMEPNFETSFYGYNNYIRLSSIKETVDPWGLFFAQTAVGSEKWYITGQEDWLTKQTGQLCPKI